MIVLPDADRPALQDINHDISKNEPYVTALRSSSPLLVIPIAKAGERVVVGSSRRNRRAEVGNLGDDGRCAHAILTTPELLAALPPAVSQGLR
jgi:hypothetical protein